MHLIGMYVGIYLSLACISLEHASYVYLTDVCIFHRPYASHRVCASHGRVPLIGVYLMGVHLMGLPLTGVHLMGVYLMGVYGVSYGRAPYRHAPYGRAPYRCVP